MSSWQIVVAEESRTSWLPVAVAVVLVFALTPVMIEIVVASMSPWIVAPVPVAVSSALQVNPVSSSCATQWRAVRTRFGATSVPLQAELSAKTIRTTESCALVSTVPLTIASRVVPISVGAAHAATTKSSAASRSAGIGLNSDAHTPVALHCGVRCARVAAVARLRAGLPALGGAVIGVVFADRSALVDVNRRAAPAARVDAAVAAGRRRPGAIRVGFARRRHRRRGRLFLARCKDQ